MARCTSLLPTRAGHASRSLSAPSPETAGRDGVHGPGAALRLHALRDEGAGDGQPRPVVPLQGLAGGGEVQRVAPETVLGEGRGGGAQPVLVAATVVGSDLPDHLGMAADGPNSS